ncbi:MAG: hypothetical protein V1750_02755, partial [Acidobacteriota bacterium]
MTLANQVARTARRRGKAGAKEKVSLPSLRSAGVSLVRDRRDERTAALFAKRYQLNATLEDGGEPELWADDLLRGYRVDVLDGAAGAWRSLCARDTVIAALDGSPLATDTDEGWVSLAATQSTDPDEEGGQDLYVHEALCRWSGWSLVAQRPGKHLDKNNQASDAGNEPTTDLQLRISVHAAKGTLPRLRFGHNYRLRARAVDLAGNSLTLSQADEFCSGARLDQVATDGPFIYRRFEPVAQPVVVLRKPLGSQATALRSRPIARTRGSGAPKPTGHLGETLERLVIRSFNSRPELDATSSQEVTERHLAPPGAAELTAEVHGAFDDAGRLQCGAYATIVAKDESLAEGAHDVDQLALPYLPDPPARGAAFAGLRAATLPANRVTRFRADGNASTWPITPGATPAASVVQVDFGAPELWPEMKPFRLKVVGTLAARDPVWDAGRRELTVFLPPGEITRVRLSSYLEAADLDKMALWQWIKDSGQAASLEKQALAGVHWMLTPGRELVLVHAVQQPLVAPAFVNLRAIRKPGEAFAVLQDAFPIGGTSTVKVDIQCAWLEPIDTGIPGEPPRLVEGKAQAFEAPVEYADKEVRFGPERLYRFVPAYVAAEKRLVGAAPAAAAAARPQAVALRRPVTRDAAVQAAPRAGLAVSRERFAVSLEREQEARTITVSRHHFGDTKHRDIAYTAIATTRYREYLPFSDAEIAAAETDPASSKRITRRSLPRSVDIPSSARPAAPRVLYVIPTFGWEKSSGAAGITSKRTGGGLRVYLERPWFSTGAGELLGVVVALPPPQATLFVPPPIPPAQKPYVTQWAMDPLWRSTPTPSVASPRLENFRNPRKTESGLTLDELPGARVAVAGFAAG